LQRTHINNKTLIFLLFKAKKDNKIEKIIIIELKKIKVKLVRYDQPPFPIIASEPR